MLRVGVIGAGSMGRHHVRIYHGIPNCQLIGVSDPNEEKAELASKYDARFFPDYRELLGMQPDLVTISAPTKLHHQLAKDAMQAGCNVLIEKPIADNLESAQELDSLAQELNKTLAVGHIERFNPAVVELKKLIDSGELGEILNINNLRVGPYHGRILDTGIILDLGTHDVDLINYLLDSRAKAVFATAQSRVHNHEDHAVMHLSFDGNQTGIIETSWLAPYQARNVFVMGTKHFALCDLMNKLILIYEDNPRGGNLLAGLRTVPPGDALENQLSSVIQNVIDGTAPVSGAKDSIHALKTCLAALESVNSGQAVPVGS